MATTTRLGLPLSVGKEKTVPSAGKYERVFDAINRHAYAATTRLVGNDYARAKEIADAVRATCAAGMVPMLDTEVVTAAVAYLRGRDERRDPRPR